MGGKPAIQPIRNEEHYRIVVEEKVLGAEVSVRIATANVKNLHVLKGKKARSILLCFEEIVDRGVSIRILHGASPSRPFREALEKSAGLTHNERFEMMLCARNHMKIVLVDDKFLYTGSANFTGAGLGAKSPERRNFEVGFVTHDISLVNYYRELFNEIWEGSHCAACGRRDYCG